MANVRQISSTSCSAYVCNDIVFYIFTVYENSLEDGWLISVKGWKVAGAASECPFEDTIWYLMALSVCSFHCSVLIVYEGFLKEKKN